MNEDFMLYFSIVEKDLENKKYLEIQNKLPTCITFLRNLKQYIVEYKEIHKNKKITDEKIQKIRIVLIIWIMNILSNPFVFKTKENNEILEFVFECVEIISLEKFCVRCIALLLKKSDNCIEIYESNIFGKKVSNHVFFSIINHLSKLVCLSIYFSDENENIVRFFEFDHKNFEQKKKVVKIIFKTNFIKINHSNLIKRRIFKILTNQTLKGVFDSIKILNYIINNLREENMQVSWTLAKCYEKISKFVKNSDKFLLDVFKRDIFANESLYINALTILSFYILNDRILHKENNRIKNLNENIDYENEILFYVLNLMSRDKSNDTKVVYLREMCLFFVWCLVKKKRKIPSVIFCEVFINSLLDSNLNCRRGAASIIREFIGRNNLFNGNLYLEIVENDNIFRIQKCFSALESLLCNKNIVKYIKDTKNSKNPKNYEYYGYLNSDVEMCKNEKEKTDIKSEISKSEISDSNLCENIENIISKDLFHSKEVSKEEICETENIENNLFEKKYESSKNLYICPELLSVCIFKRLIDSVFHYNLEIRIYSSKLLVKHFYKRLVYFKNYLNGNEIWLKILKEIFLGNDSSEIKNNNFLKFEIYSAVNTIKKEIFEIRSINTDLNILDFNVLHGIILVCNEILVQEIDLRIILKVFEIKLKKFFGMKNFEDFCKTFLEIFIKILNQGKIINENIFGIKCKNFHTEDTYCDISSHIESQIDNIIFVFDKNILPEYSEFIGKIMCRFSENFRKLSLLGLRRKNNKSYICCNLFNEIDRNLVLEKYLKNIEGNDYNVKSNTVCAIRKWFINYKIEKVKEFMSNEYLKTIENNILLGMENYEVSFSGDVGFFVRKECFLTSLFLEINEDILMESFIRFMVDKSREFRQICIEIVLNVQNNISSEINQSNTNFYSSNENNIPLVLQSDNNVLEKDDKIENKINEIFESKSSSIKKFLNQYLSFKNELVENLYGDELHFKICFKILDTLNDNFKYEFYQGVLSSWKHSDSSLFNFLFKNLYESRKNLIFFLLKFLDTENSLNYLNKKIKIKRIALPSLIFINEVIDFEINEDNKIYLLNTDLYQSVLNISKKSSNSKILSICELIIEKYKRFLLIDNSFE
ncbi:hypothetical protein CWI39_0440p0020 [Hamiltosporidium magnivora]|uniref:Uncharacterized protein n=1 Tax=Hamiltosporidium magnivora TaxID=148818 RepID=A0A4Q9LF92_9MICR|nr:hypothetical protein CWI39_0440p0020 [Hamiltosporidium magnivora]